MSSSHPIFYVYLNTIGGTLPVMTVAEGIVPRIGSTCQMCGQDPITVHRASHVIVIGEFIAGSVRKAPPLNPNYAQRLDPIPLQYRAHAVCQQACDNHRERNRKFASIYFVVTLDEWNEAIKQSALSQDVFRVHNA